MSDNGVVASIPPTQRHTLTHDNDAYCPSVSFLRKFGISDQTLCHWQTIAAENGTNAARELIANGGITETTYYKALARHLSVEFVTAQDIPSVIKRDHNSISAFSTRTVVWGLVGGVKPKAIFAPDPQQIPQLEKILDGASDPATRLMITSPSEMRAMLVREYSDKVVGEITNYLAINQPRWSARQGGGAWQGAVLAVLLMLSAGILFLKPGLFSLGTHLFLSLFFALCVALRVLAAINFYKPEICLLTQTSNKTKPIYSVMIALHDEAPIVPKLIAALKKIQWPQSKLEIKLVCEADDAATLAALAAQNLDRRFEIIHVPACQPRTKPKALCYALGFTSGKYITIYDAEDVPHPEQLLEAYEKFETGPANLACVQAPLSISNASVNMWTSLFHFEYAGLFFGLLPWLARRNAPIMLGGTSNHFDRRALIQVGAWDPYNVTEDADLGLRLHQHGYRTAMISRPTLEAAPRNFKTWLPQRTRWFKGWMQTWIVHFRNPAHFFKNASLGSALITQALLTGTLVSALFHPLLVLKATYLTFLFYTAPLTHHLTTIAAIDWTSIVLSYVGYMALCWRGTNEQVKQKVGLRILLTPIYWMAISLAAWRALIQLNTKPFHWEKTPHNPDD